MGKHVSVGPSDYHYHQPRRGLSREEAAAYIGLGTTSFDELVADGRMPKPLSVGRRRIWDIRRLDAAFDALSYEAPQVRDFVL